MIVYFVIAGLNYQRTITTIEVTGIKGILYSVIDAGSGRDLPTTLKNKTHEEIAKMYPYRRPRIADKLVRIIREYGSKGISFFLDSGAFQMREKTGYISIDEYVDFIRCYGRKFDVVAGLDVIGDTEKSIENYKYMIKNGADHDNLVLAWHHGQPLELLDKVMSMTDYVGIGGTAKGLDIGGKIRAVNKILDYIHKKDRKTKVHVFGTGRPYVYRHYQNKAHSVDATTWNIGSKYAQLLSLSGLKTVNYWGKMPRGSKNRDAVDLYNTFKMVECGTQ